MIALRREFHEEKPNMIDSESPVAEELQCLEETKTYKDVEVQVNYLVHLTGQSKLLKHVFYVQLCYNTSTMVVFDLQ